MGPCDVHIGVPVKFCEPSATFERLKSPHWAETSDTSLMQAYVFHTMSIVRMNVDNGKWHLEADKRYTGKEQRLLFFGSWVYKNNDKNRTFSK